MAETHNNNQTTKQEKKSSRTAPPARMSAVLDRHCAGCAIDR